MRDAFCSTLIEMAKKDDRICLLDADLMGAMGTKPFLKEFPDRAIDCGIQEANMVGVAAGLAAQGKSRLRIHSVFLQRAVRATRSLFRAHMPD